jgi:Zn-finger domain-containing protein
MPYCEDCHDEIILRTYCHTCYSNLQAENARYREALEIIAGYRQCIDNLMGNVDIARAALESPLSEED